MFHICLHSLFSIVFLTRFIITLNTNYKSNTELFFLINMVFLLCYDNTQCISINNLNVFFSFTIYDY